MQMLSKIDFLADLTQIMELHSQTVVKKKKYSILLTSRFYCKLECLIGVVEQEC